MKVKGKPLEIQIRYKPMPKQSEFHGNAAKYRAFGGGVGNGKTSAGCVECLNLSLEYPGTQGVILRKTRPELKSTTMDVFFNGGGGDPDRGDYAGLPQELIRSWNKSDLKLTLINGSVVYFMPLDDIHKLKNMNLGWFMIDQAEEIPEEFFQMLQSRLRRKNSPRKGIVLFNPEGHDWIWRRWVYLKYPDHKLIHAKTWDNPNLPSDFMAGLETWPDSWKKRYIEGSFEVFTGQIWPEFDPEVHTIQPFIIPDWYEWVEAIDHGKRNPTAINWQAYDDSENCFVVDEHYEAGKQPSYHAAKLLEKRAVLGCNPFYTVIDASAAQKDPETERSVMDEYWDQGVYVQPSDRHIIARVARVAEYLRLDPLHAHPITKEVREEGWPRLYIFRNCVNLIEHVQQYKWKPVRPGAEEDAPEKPLKKDDHDVDALGYGLMTRAPLGKRPRSPGSHDARSQAYWGRIRDKMEQTGGRVHSQLGSEY